jgi:hypothetical protein
LVVVRSPDPPPPPPPKRNPILHTSAHGKQ